MVPRLAFLPPTRGRSSSVYSSNQTMYGLAVRSVMAPLPCAVRTVDNGWSGTVGHARHIYGPPGVGTSGGTHRSSSCQVGSDSICGTTISCTRFR